MSVLQNIRGLKKKRMPVTVKQVPLKLVHIDFWSAIKAGFFVTLAGAIATIVGFVLLWVVVSNTGLFSSVNSLINSVLGADSGVDVADSLSLPRVLTFAFLVSVVNMVLGTLLSGVVALLFNLIARFTGGIRVSFTNDQ